MNKQSDFPLVSIIIPVYLGKKYMREAIDSALNQTYKNIEVIVINDGSPDNGKTEEIALSYGDKIRYFRKENGGVSSALNLGIQNMKGEYFSWLSHDDFYAPDKIEKQLSYIKDKNTLVLCATKQIDKNSNLLPYQKNKKETKLLSWKQAVMYIIKNSACGCAFLIPKRAFDIVGYFDENLRYCQDVLMWWKIFLAHFSLQLTDDVGVFSRVHEQQVSRLRSELFQHDANYIGNFIPQQFAEMDVSNQYLFQYTKQEAIHGNLDVVRKGRIEAQKHNPFSFLQNTELLVCSVYGKIRPVIRKMYYRFVRGIK